jgi:hypothetical protein
MVFAAFVTLDTYVTPHIYSIDSMSSCAYEASPEPELRSSPASADIPELDVSLEDLNYHVRKKEVTLIVWSLLQLSMGGGGLVVGMC